MVLRVACAWAAHRELQHGCPGQLKSTKVPIALLPLAIMVVAAALYSSIEMKHRHLVQHPRH
jgi:hypothetical protein